MTFCTAYRTLGRFLVACDNFSELAVFWLWLLLCDLGSSC